MTGKTMVRGLRSALTMTCALLGSIAATSAMAGVPYDGGDYIPAPPGTKVVLFYGQWANARGLYRDDRNVDPDARLETHLAIIRLVRFTELAGMPFNYQLLQPLGSAEAGGSVKALGHSGGLGDTIVSATLWPVADAKRGTYIGISPYLFVPVGDYDRNRGINFGENRWKAVMQVGGSQRVTKHIVAELGADVTFFGRNTRFDGSRTLSQRASFSAIGHLRYLIDDKNEFNVRAIHTIGGSTRIDGVASGAQSHGWSALATYRRTLPHQMQLMVQGGRDLSIDNGFRERARVQVRLLKAF